MQRGRFLRALCCTVSLVVARLRLPAPRTRMRPTSRASSRARDTGPEAGRRGAGERHARGDVPDDRSRRRGPHNLPLEFFARVIWQESRFQLRRGGAGDAQRPARAGHRAVHAGHRERARPARSLRSGAGAAEIGRVSRRAARPVRQSRPRGRGLQCRPAAGAGMARRHRPHAAGDAQLCCRHHRLHGRGVGRRRSRTGKTPERTPTSELPRVDGAAEARAQSVRHRPRTAHHARRRQTVGRAARRRLSAATRRWRCMPAPSSGSAP